jgi:hypothetical protein
MAQMRKMLSKCITRLSLIDNTMACVPYVTIIIAKQCMDR